MSASTSTRDVEATIRDVVEPLANLTRRAGSPDERRAAEMIVEAFGRAGAKAHIEEVPFRDGYAELVMLEGEGPFVMHDYTDSSFRDLVARVAERATGAPLRRGAPARASTDSIVPSRAGYPTATIVSCEPDTKLQSNYHLPTDVPEHVRYDTVATAVTIAEALARELAE